VEIVRVLLHHYPEIDVLARAGQDGKSVLSYAFEAGNHEVLGLILSHSSAAALEQGKKKEEEGEKDSSEPTVDSNGAANSGGDAGTGVSQAEFAALAAAEDAPIQSLTHLFTFEPGNSYSPTISVRELAQPNQAVPETPEDLDVLGEHNNSDWTGLYVWTASIVMARWVIALRTELQGRTVLELGAGCGLPGLAALLFSRAKHVTLSDLHTRTVENLTHNLRETVALREMALQAAADAKQSTLSNEGQLAPELKQVRGMNAADPDFAPARLTARCSSVVLNWFDSTTWPAEPQDVLLGSDVIYTPALAPGLADAAAQLLKPGGIFLLVHGEERAGVPELVECLEARGFHATSERQAPESYFEVPGLAGLTPNQVDMHFPDLHPDAVYTLRKFTKRA
jgi:predicted nicotinamide N-methyase